MLRPELELRQDSDLALNASMHKCHLPECSPFSFCGHSWLKGFGVFNV